MAFTEGNLKGLSIPPYCPFFNPAEQAIRFIKAKARMIKVRQQLFNYESLMQSVSQISPYHCAKFIKECEVNQSKYKRDL
jgi:hypothetical protein